MQFYCPACFAEIERADRVCPVCGANVAEWEQSHTFTERLIHALKHRNSEARMGAIISLGNRGETVVAVPLAECALAHPTDIVQNLEIIASLSRLPDSPERARAFAMLANHPAQPIRRAAARLA